MPGGMETALSIAFGLPYVVATSVSQSRDMVVEAVYGATSLSGAGQYGGITNTGTLYVKGFQDATYAPSPQDRLVVKIEGYTHEFIVKEARGDNQATTAAVWLAAPHRLRYVHRMPGWFEVEIGAGYDGRSFTAEVTGWYKYKGVRYDLSIASTGVSSGTSDYHGEETKIQYVLKGEVKGGDLEVDVEETHSLETASATNLRLLYSQRGSASRFNATLNNVLRLGGREYRLKDIQVQTDFKTKGGVSSFHFNGLEGVVLEDNLPYGECVLQSERAALKTESGLIPLELPVLRIEPSSKND